MSEITYRRLMEEDLEAFVGMRINQLLEEGAEQTCDLRPSLLEYYRNNMPNGNFISWIALDGDEIIATSGLSFAQKPPYFGNETGKYGILSSMYTIKEYRRRGIAKKLLQIEIDEAKAHGCGQVWITASDMGVFLYSDFGFKPNGNFMAYKIK